MASDGCTHTHTHTLVYIFSPLYQHIDPAVHRDLDDLVAKHLLEKGVGTSKNVGV